jgi:hypothetical protein
MPVRTGVDCALRFSAAAGPVVGAGSPADTWLNRVGLLRGGAVDQPYLTPRLAVRGSSVRFGVMRTRDVREDEADVRAAAQRAGSRGAMVAGSTIGSGLCAL